MINHLTSKRSQALPHTNHPLPKVANFTSNKLAAHSQDAGEYPQKTSQPVSEGIIFQIRHKLTRTHRATSPSAPSKSLPKLSVRTVPSPSGFVCALATPSGKCALPQILNRSIESQNRGNSRPTGGVEIENRTGWTNTSKHNRYNAKRRHWRKTRLGI